MSFQAVAALVVLLMAMVVGLLWWLSRSIEKGAEAHVAKRALIEARERKSRGDKIMAEPVADDVAWRRRTRRRLRDNRR